MGAVVSGAKPFVALGVSGRTASGKSTLIRGMQLVPWVQVISFGRYVVAQAKNQGLPIDKPTLQKLGDELVGRDAKTFLTNAIEASGPPDTAIRVAVFDGIRHETIWSAIEDHYQIAHGIGLRCTEAICLKRLMDRDGISSEQAMAILAHPMEKAAERFVSNAAVTLCTDLLDRDDVGRAGRAIAEMFRGP